ncbi:MAG: linear amide C-N hydrolase [Oscillospiraceae bacterium]|nr:linear amide C-N hydrolase [Oscillospiraceae bacterium]
MSITIYRVIIRFRSCRRRRENGCSALSVKNSAGEALFGRSFDWYGCDALIMLSKPQNGYASISTVNTNFIKNAYRGFNSLPEKIRSIVSLYAPLDGMNEKGLCAAVLYIEDDAKINQSTDKPDITTTTAIRLLLNKAADVDEAIALLNQYDMHDSLGMMVHFAISDANGKCAAVEYIDNEMIVTQSPVVTNFYLAEGNKQGIDSSQSHTRFETLTDTLNAKPVMEADDIKNALENVSKHHFNDGETTEWSIVYNQAQGTAQYFHRENYDKSYIFSIQ